MLRFAPLGAVTFLVTACQPGGPGLTEQHRAAIQDSVRQTLEDYTATVNAHNFDAATEYFADDPGFRWAEDGRIAYPSYDSVITTFNTLKNVITEISITWNDVVVTPLGPGTAAMTAMFHEAFTDTAGTTTEYGGAVMIALRHEADGWRFVAGHASSEPRPTPE